MGTTFPCPSGELLEKGLAALGFPKDDGFVSSGPDSLRIRGIGTIVKLANLYIKELELFNAVFDLVGVESGSEQGRSDLVVRHILDSLAPWKELAPVLSERGAGGKKIEAADAGSGAGFPGIPLSIAFPDIHFTLIERMSRRCSFLENCAAMLGLKNVQVLNLEVEKASPHAFDLVVFRAFRPLDKAMIRTLLKLLAKDGVLAAYKAKREKIDEEMDTIAAEVKGWEVLPLTVPFLEFEQRHLVLTS